MLIKLKELILESEVGNFYIKVGEKIESINKQFNELKTMLLKFDKKRTKATLDEIEKNINKLKNILSDSYYFEK